VTKYILLLEEFEMSTISNGELPQDTLSKISDGHFLNHEASTAYKRMEEAARRDGIIWNITDSYRTLQRQKDLVARKGLYSEGGFAAEPGKSNHGWGSAVDLSVKQGDAAHTWLINNASKYGFTTISREPWHWEHKESAVKISKQTRLAGPSIPKEKSIWSTITNFIKNKFGKNTQTIYKLGDTHNVILEIQKKLKDFGLYSGEITGFYTKQTEKAIIRYQTENNLKIDGIAGPETLTSLFLKSRKKKDSIDRTIVSKENTDFDSLVKIIIDNLEGGYFHPNMYKKDPSFFNNYSKSGETMFGLDRHAGHDLFYKDKRKSSDVFKNMEYIEKGEYTYTNQYAERFWKLIDSKNAKENWKWRYDGGEIREELIKLASNIIKPYFIELMNTFLSSEAIKIIKRDGRLLFHFIYATWNGRGWFRKFANDINSLIESGINDPDELVEQAIYSRTQEGLIKGSKPNSLISKTGKKIETLIS